MNKIAKLNRWLIVLVAIIAIILIIYSLSEKEVEMVKYDVNSNVTELKISVVGDLKIYLSDDFRIETSNELVSINESDGILEIKETSNFDELNMKDVTELYIPYDYEFKNVEISSILGNVFIGYIKADRFYLYSQASYVMINELITNDETIFDVGGELKLEGGKINNLRYSQLHGSSFIRADIIGNSSADVKRGKAIIILEKLNNYTFNIENNKGTIKVNGNEFNKKKYGKGKTTFKIENDEGIIEIRERISSNA